jgi:hypothetical protein
MQQSQIKNLQEQIFVLTENVNSLKRLIFEAIQVADKPYSTGEGNYAQTPISKGSNVINPTPVIQAPTSNQQHPYGTPVRIRGYRLPIYYIDRSVSPAVYRDPNGNIITREQANELMRRFLRQNRR